MEDEKIELDNFKSSLGLHIEDPWERVKYLFMKNHHGESHPDLVQAINMAQIGFLGGMTYGGYIFQKEAILNIKERSDTRMFHSRRQAYREISAESLKGFVKGAFKWGPRYAIFTGGFKLFSSCVEAYRNKSGIIEYSIGGSVIGSCLRFNFGIRGMLVGGLVGMTLGTAYGATYVCLSKLLGLESVQIKYGQYALSKYYDSKVKSGWAELEGLQNVKDKGDLKGNLNPLSSWTGDEDPGSSK